jgi:NADPH-dependent 2,4-dienoyl-CoA reductase/sulfur reductase-like enzyme
MKVVIVGGVAGGASAAARLRRLDEDAEIVMLERTGYVSYANCGLPYYVGGVITEERKLTLQTPQSFSSRFNVDARVNSEAVSIDRANKKVLVRSTLTGEQYRESYDKLILSPGAKAMRPDIPGIDDPRVMSLRTVEDTFAMRRSVTENRPERAVVCGAGYIGLEVAENLCNLGIEVSVVQRPDHVLPPLDYDMAADVHHHLRSHGIKLHLSDALESIGTDGGLKAVLRSGKRLDADLIIVALGVVPDTGLARDCGLELGVKGTIVVDDHMRTSDPDIYAVGDAVQVKNYVTGTAANIALAGPANKQGRIAADNIAGMDSVFRGSLGSSVIKRFDMTVATTGINERQARDLSVPYDKVYTYSASHATYYPGGKNMSVKILFDPRDGKILGAQIVGYDGVEKRADVLATAIHGGMTVYDLEELDLTYAPPFSSAKDPVNYAGFVAVNVLQGRVKQCFWNEMDGLAESDDCFLVDVRTPKEFDLGHIEGSVNIPVDDIRGRMDEIPRDKRIVLICQSALRSYIAARILMQKGYDCCHLAGGWRLYSLVVRDRCSGSPDDQPCGVAR